MQITFNGKETKVEEGSVINVNLTSSSSNNLH